MADCCKINLGLKPVEEDINCIVIIQKVCEICKTWHNVEYLGQCNCKKYDLLCPNCYCENCES